ncbi:DUF2530 domain-containing protein [Ruania albidiflava]|uniref:DUF2530 domain-containing protein n=1 Tax=Ruania albidiflava TaxID=366586 RepID=UPI00146E7540|nr:DUF2530 domain-containing protein [Ruania albidiflava]
MNHPHPSPPELKPARVNVKALFLAGTIAWLLGLLGVGVAFLAGRSPDPRLALVCVAGIVLGMIGYWWVHVVHLVDDEGMSA